MKKIRSLENFGIVALCALLLTGCSANAPESTSPATASVEAGALAGDASSQASGEPVVVSDLTGLAAYDEDDLNTDWQAADRTAIRLNGAGAEIDGEGAAAANGGVSITTPGTYEISGKLDDGQLVVSVGDKGTVHLILNGAEIRSSSSSPIYVEQSDKTIITLAAGTDNIVADADSYVYPDASTDEPDAAIFSKDDLTINGEGGLVVHGNYKDGIKSKDDLKIAGGDLNVAAVDDGIIGRDLLAIRAGSLTIEAGGDGLKATNDTDADKGAIVLAGGSFVINAGRDGIQAETSILIEDGEYKLVTGGGSGASLSDTESAKGIKAGADIQVNGGTFDIDAADDALHGNGNIAINGGALGLASGDDGIHADASIVLAGGSIRITRSYEGIESANITVAGGEVHVVSSDDGINVAGGNDGSAGGGRFGQDRFNDSGSGNKLVISGGYLYVDAQGDGLDANGSIAMSGGTVLVNGPTGNNNGALDYDGTFDQTGGFLIAAGSAGMAQAASEQSTQGGILMTYSQPQAAGTLIHLADNAGKAIVTFAPTKSYQAVFVSSPELRPGEAYTLYSGGTSTGDVTDGLYDGDGYEGGTKIVSFEMATIVTWLNESGVTEARAAGPGGFGGGGGGGRGRR